MTARWRVSGPVVTLLLALLIHVVGMLLIMVSVQMFLDGVGEYL